MSKGKSVSNVAFVLEKKPSHLLENYEGYECKIRLRVWFIIHMKAIIYLLSNCIFMCVSPKSFFLLYL